LDTDAVAAMVGGNMLRAYTFDVDAVKAAAARVGPTVEDLAFPPSADDVSFWASKSPSFVAA
jgi:hypothetical protein